VEKTLDRESAKKKLFFAQAFSLFIECQCKIFLCAERLKKYGRCPRGKKEKGHVENLVIDCFFFYLGGQAAKKKLKQ
jgi:hypothetical protein